MLEAFRSICASLFFPRDSKFMNEGSAAEILRGERIEYSGEALDSSSSAIAYYILVFDASMQLQPGEEIIDTVEMYASAEIKESRRSTEGVACFELSAPSWGGVVPLHGSASEISYAGVKGDGELHRIDVGRAKSFVSTVSICGAQLYGGAFNSSFSSIDLHASECHSKTEHGDTSRMLILKGEVVDIAGGRLDSMTDLCIEHIGETFLPGPRAPPWGGVFSLSGPASAILSAKVKSNGALDRIVVSQLSRRLFGGSVDTAGLVKDTATLVSREYTDLSLIWSVQTDTFISQLDTEGVAARVALVLHALCSEQSGVPYTMRGDGVLISEISHTCTGVHSFGDAYGEKLCVEPSASMVTVTSVSGDGGSALTFVAARRTFGDTYDGELDKVDVSQHLRRGEHVVVTVLSCGLVNVTTILRETTYR